MPGLDDMTMSDFEALGPEQQQALLEHGALPQEQAQEQPVETTAPPEASAQPTEDPAQVAAAVPADPSSEEIVGNNSGSRSGNPEVPLRQTREELRQLRAQHEQALALLNNPQAMLHYLAQQGMVQLPGQAPEEEPDFDLDPQAAIQHHVSQAVAPLQQNLQTLQEQLMQERREKEMLALAQKYPGLHDVVPQFDAQYPHQAGLHPELKYLIAKGLEASNPQAQQAQIEAKAQALAEQKLAQQLAQMGNKTAPVTLGGVPPARANDVPVDIENMSYADFEKLTPDQVRKLQAQM